MPTPSRGHAPAARLCIHSRLTLTAPGTERPSGITGMRRGCGWDRPGRVAVLRAVGVRSPLRVLLPLLGRIRHNMSLLVRVALEIEEAPRLSTEASFVGYK